jgi:hypothetical protein
LRHHYGAFPNVGRLGAYRPRSQTVHIECADREGVEYYNREGHLHLGSRFFTTWAHELTHWLDHVSTLCGQEYLILIYNAWHALSSRQQGSEHEYWRGIRLRDWERRHHRNAYYTIPGSGDATYRPDAPWATELTSGLEFDLEGRLCRDRPIMFIHFQEHHSRQLIVRQPITVAALWETTAVWSELVTEFQLLQNVPDDERMIYVQLWAREHLIRVYSKDLSLYSAPAHIMSIRTGTKDLHLTYMLAAAVTNICLNMSNRLFRRIRPPASFKQFDRKRLNGFAEHADRGYLFVVLCASGPQWEPGTTADEWINEALARCGLPDSSEILDEARERMQRLQAQAIEGRFRPVLDYLLAIGLQNFDARRREAHPGISLAQIARGAYLLPPAILNDGNVISPMPEAGRLDMSMHNPEGMVGFEHRLIDLLDNFTGACR